MVRYNTGPFKQTLPFIFYVRAKLDLPRLKPFLPLSILGKSIFVWRPINVSGVINNYRSGTRKTPTWGIMPKHPAACAWLQVHLNRLDGNEGEERLLHAFGDAVCLQVEKQICFTGS